MKKIIILMSILSLNSYANNENNFNLTIPKTNLVIVSNDSENSNDSVDIGLGSGSQTTPDETILQQEIIQDNDGYNILYKKDVTNSTYLVYSDWKTLRDSATEGFKITKTNGDVFYIPLSAFSVDANCHSLYDDSTNDFQGTKVGDSSPDNFEIVLYHHETEYCSMSGSDYSFIIISYTRSIFGFYNYSGYISSLGTSTVLAKEISIK